jgi:hypothetical protein
MIIKTTDKYTLERVRDRIYLLSFKDQYNMCMHFLRLQEFYESPNPKFRGKVFDIFEFMEWYSKEYGKGSFTYPKDWGGFNVPSEVFDELDILWSDIQTKTIYDYEMYQVYRDITLDIINAGKSYEVDFYLIGILDKDAATFDHEMAHALFYIEPEYKKAMNKLLKNLDKKLYEKITKYLTSIGYSSTVFHDEAQAYLATGFTKRSKIKAKQATKPFIDVFNQFMRK